MAINILLLGPPGSGKGTQAEKLVKKFNLVYFSTGNYSRKLAQGKTKKGKLIAKILKRGKLIPSEIIDEFVLKSISSLSKDQGFIFDGYPRDLLQVKFLEKILEKKVIKNLKVIYLDLLPSEVLARLSLRLFCENCGASYIEKEISSVICQHCGGGLVRRADDTPSVIRKRLKEYLIKTKPVLDYFKKRGVLKIVNGNQPIEEVFREILRKISDGSN